MICKHILEIKFSHESELICLHKVKCFHVFLHNSQNLTPDICLHTYFVLFDL